MTQKASGSSKRFVAQLRASGYLDFEDKLNTNIMNAPDDIDPTSIHFLVQARQNARANTILIAKAIRIVEGG